MRLERNPEIPVAPGEEQYSANLIYMGGTDYQDKTGSDGSFTHGAPKYYGTNANASDYIN